MIFNPALQQSALELPPLDQAYRQAAYPRLVAGKEENLSVTSQRGDAQGSAMPVVGFLSSESPGESASVPAAFRADRRRTGAGTRVRSGQASASPRERAGDLRTCVRPWVLLLAGEGCRRCPQQFPFGGKPVLLRLAVRAAICGPHFIGAFANAVFQALVHRSSPSGLMMERP
jgi:hypothetical protein